MIQGLHNIRPAQTHEAEALSELALRSKAYWPYRDDFIERCRDELCLDPIHIRNRMVFLFEQNCEIVGYYAFSEEKNGPEMIALFVEPDWIGKGVGKQLWFHALKFAKNKGWRRFNIVADPFAASGFYLPMGCQQVGEVSSNVVKGRKLPLLEYTVV